MKIKQITLYVLACAVLVGCDSRIDAVNQEMANIRNQPPLLLNQHRFYSCTTI